MRVLTFDAREPDVYKWIVTCFNMAPTAGQTTEQVRRNISVIDKLLAVGDPDDAAEPWPAMDTAYALTGEDAREVKLTEAELKWLDQQFRAGMALMRPLVQSRFFKKCTEFLQDARHEKAERPAAAEPKSEPK